MNATRVLVADALPIFRTGVCRLLLRSPEFDVMEAGSLDELVRLGDSWPDVVLLDVDLPPLGARAAIDWLTEHGDASIIVWGLEPTADDVLELIRAGARGYLHKGISPEGLVRSLHGVVRGEAPLSRCLAKIMIDALHGLEEQTRLWELAGRLSDRERQVLDLIAGGARNKQIAGVLAISEYTVKRHVQNILKKLDLSSRLAAADFYRTAFGESAQGARRLELV